MKKHEQLRDYREELIESLRDPAEATAYLNAALAETDMPEVFLLALHNVAEAQGFAKLARKAKLDRAGLYRMLSAKGNPELRSLLSLLDNFGMRLQLVLKKTA